MQRVAQQHEGALPLGGVPRRPDLAVSICTLISQERRAPGLPLLCLGLKVPPPLPCLHPVPGPGSYVLAQSGWHREPTALSVDRL